MRVGQPDSNKFQEGTVVLKQPNLSIAQSGSAVVLGTTGRRFESC